MAGPYRSITYKHRPYTNGSVENQNLKWKAEYDETWAIVRHQKNECKGLEGIESFSLWRASLKQKQ